MEVKDCFKWFRPRSIIIEKPFNAITQDFYLKCVYSDDEIRGMYNNKEGAEKFLEKVREYEKELLTDRNI